MRTSNSFTAFVTGLAFLSQTGLGQIQSASAQTPGAPGSQAFSVPTANPATLNMQVSMSNVQAAIAKCQAGAFGNDPNVQNGLSKLGDLLTKNKSKTKTAAETDVKTKCSIYDTPVASSSNKPALDPADKAKVCKMTCDEPSGVPKVISCTSVYKKGPKVLDEGNWKPNEGFIKDGGDANILAWSTKIAAYEDYLQYKADNCISHDQGELRKQHDAYVCSLNALKGASSDAANQLQTVLQQNTAQYGKMVQFQQEVGDQVRQIDDILGPDKDIGSVGGGQFQGLLGMQKALNENMPKMIQAETDFKTQSEQVQKDSDASEQTLEADRMSQVVDCMKGNRNLGVSGGRSLTCFKPTMRTSNDASGKPVSSPALDASGNIIYSKQACGALEYVRSQVEQSAYITGRGVIRSQARTEQAQQNTAAFDSMIDAMTRDMGGYDAATGDGKLVGRNTKWSDLAAKYSGDMAEISSKTGINIQSQMSAVAGSCYKSGDQWRVQQMRSASSDYAKRKKTISDNKAKLAAQINTGLSDLNKSYGEAIAVLGNQAVSIDRTGCTTTDTSKMQKCFADMRKQVSNLLEGNGSSVTTKTFTGGALVQGFAVPCKGINGCVTALQNVRKAKKEQNASAQKAKIQFVNDGNTAIQKQLGDFGKYLNSVQASVAGQFDMMKNLVFKMTGESPSNLKFMDPEQLKASEGADKTPGPFEAPKNMASVLSGLTPPNGLINFTDDGMTELMKVAAQKGKDDLAAAKEKKQKYADIADKLSSLSESCADATESASNKGGSGGVTNDTTDTNDCPAILAQYDHVKASGAVGEVLKGMYQAVSFLAKLTPDAKASATVSSAGSGDKALEDKVNDCRTASTAKVESRAPVRAGAAGGSTIAN